MRNEYFEIVAMPGTIVAKFDRLADRP